MHVYIYICVYAWIHLDLDCHRLSLSSTQDYQPGQMSYDTYYLQA